MNVDQVFTGCLLYQRLPEGAAFLQLPVYPSQKQPLQLDQQGSNPQFHPCILAVSQCNAKHNNTQENYMMLEDQLLIFTY